MPISDEKIRMLLPYMAKAKSEIATYVRSGAERQDWPGTPASLEPSRACVERVQDVIHSARPEVHGDEPQPIGTCQAVGCIYLERSVPRPTWHAVVVGPGFQPQLRDSGLRPVLRSRRMITTCPPATVV